MNTRIELTDSAHSMVFKMSEGNPGAVSVCAQIMGQGEIVDPDMAIGSIMPIFLLDTLGIYSSRIWMLYKDVCGESIINMLAVLRANQLGLLSSDAINHAIDNRGDGIDCDLVVEQVKLRLPNFAAQAV